jgi:hypothetical protein
MARFRIIFRDKSGFESATCIAIPSLRIVNFLFENFAFHFMEINLLSDPLLKKFLCLIIENSITFLMELYCDDVIYKKVILTADCNRKQ